MNLSLLKFMNRRVRVRKDISHQEYKVAGVNWDTEKVLVLFGTHNAWVDPSELDLVPEEDEEE